MRKEYDFSKSRKNPYAKQLKRQVTIRLDVTAVDYFKKNGGRNGDALSEPHQPVLEGLRHAEEAPHDPMAGGCGEAASRAVTDLHLTSA